MPKQPTLHQQVIGQFRAAYFAQHSVEYVVNAADRSQVGRFLSPKGGEAPPSAALLNELPAIFANFVGTDDAFDQKHGLAYLLTKALNRYRSISRAPAMNPKDARVLAAVMKPFPGSRP